ncbi:hypothetical protein, partial [Tropicimonas sp.]|uniref:hypothetical protein n=1 Tax=Tropicimonas sp. TaxID=2067044 RepID=UPI003A84E344
ERTRRLLYVTCTRAEESLALVLYSEAPDTIRSFLTSKKWMAEDEIVMAAADCTYQESVHMHSVKRGPQRSAVLDPMPQRSFP